MRKIKLYSDKPYLHDGFGISKERSMEIQEMTSHFRIDSKSETEILSKAMEKLKKDNEIIYAIFTCGIRHAEVKIASKLFN